MYTITSLFLSLLNICLKTVSILSSRDIRQEGFWSSSQNRIVAVVFIVYAMGLKTSPNNLRDCHILIYSTRLFKPTALKFSFTFNELISKCTNLL